MLVHLTLLHLTLLPRGHSFTPPAEVAGLLQGMADSLCHNTDSGWTSRNVFHVAPGRELD